MSQVKFDGVTKDGVAIEVMAGWDHPCREYFVTLFYKEPPEDEEEVLYSTISGDTDCATTEALKAKVASFGIETPEGFWERVELNERNVGHNFHDGSWRRFTI